MKTMVPARNLIGDQLHEPLSKFFHKSRFDLDRESLSKSPTVLANKADEMKDTEEKEEVGSNTNPRDWLKLGLTSSHENRKPDPIELELFTERLSCQAEKQMIGSFKRQRHGILGQHVRSSCGTVRGGDFTVVSPPPRPEAGVWLVLSAARNQ
jgi:hypothetical protein